MKVLVVVQTQFILSKLSH